MKIYARDAVELGYCVKGIKEFCNKYCIDFKELVKYGVEEEVLKKTGDAMALKVIEKVKSRSDI